MSKNTEFAQINQKIKDYIPLAGHMDIQVQLSDRVSVELFLPIEPNRNHMGSVFGGSLHIACVLSCWSLLEELYKQEGLKTNYTVIQKSEMDYKLPVRENFIAKSTYLSPEDLDRFLQNLKKKKRARVSLRSEIQLKDKVCATFVGAFVAELA